MISHYYYENMYFRKKNVSNSYGTIVYVHGLGESGLCFEKILSDHDDVPEMRRWNHFVPDLPNYGKSLPEKKCYDLNEFADLIMKISRQHVNGLMVVVGHSMGGVIGQLACERPDHPFSGFVDVEGNLTPGDCTFSSRAMAYNLDEFNRYGFDRLKDAVYQNGIKNKAQRGYFASMSFADADQFHLNSRNLLDFSETKTAVKRLKALAIPKLYIAATPSGICKESIEMLKQDNVPHQVVPESGHWPFLDQPKTFIDIFSRFLAQF